MAPEFLVSLAGILLALLFAYIPGFADWFQARTPNVKRLLMLLFLFLISIGSYGYVCLGLGNVSDVVCTQAGLVAVGKVFVSAMIANQAAYALLPKTGRNK